MSDQRVENSPRTEENQSSRAKSHDAVKAGPLDFLAGESNVFEGNLKPYLPHDLVGGAVPYVPGAERETVWNAASQACSTERVHFCYSISEGKVWYLACPSSQLASSPDTWCPLAAALPGNSEYWDRETVYLYESDGLASALRWDVETGRMQVYLGASRTILPRLQTMDANFVTINAETADIVPWRNIALRTEKLSRATARILILSGLVLNFLIILILAGQYMATHLIQRDLTEVELTTQRAVDELMLNASSTMQNTSIQHMVNVQELLDLLIKVDGTLVRYEMKNGNKAEWEALLPQAYSNGVGKLTGQVQPEIEEDGRVRMIGTR